MKRPLLNFLTIISLFAFEAVVLLWLLRAHETYVLGARDGGGGIAGGRDSALWELFVAGGRAGIGWTYTDVLSEHEASAPLWLLAIVTAALPASWLIRTIRRRPTASAVLCRTCGYHLTGNVSVACPECGKAT